MRKLLTMFMVILLGLSAYPKPAHAIILLPAVLLIPIAKIIALVIGGFSIPALGTAALIHKLFNKPLVRIILIALSSLIMLAILLAIYLKIQNPDRPFV